MISCVYMGGRATEQDVLKRFETLLILTMSNTHLFQLMRHHIYMV